MKPIVLATLLLAFTAQPAMAESARENYLLNCMGCHKLDGSGTPGKVPALKGIVAKFLHVEGGRAFLVQVPGTSQSSLDDAQTADVLNYILETFDPTHLPAPFQAYTQEEVTRYRGTAMLDAMDRRAQLALKFPPEPGQPAEPETK